MSIAQRIKDRVLRTRGKAKEKTGQLTNSNRLRAEGLADQSKAAIGNDLQVLKDVVSADVKGLKKK